MGLSAGLSMLVGRSGAVSVVVSPVLSVVPCVLGAFVLGERVEPEQPVAIRWWRPSTSMQSGGGGHMLHGGPREGAEWPAGG